MPAQSPWPDDCHGVVSLTFDDGMTSQLQIGIPISHQQHSEHHGVRRAVRRAQRNQHAPQVHPAQRLSSLRLRQSRLFRQRLQRLWLPHADQFQVHRG